MYAHKRFLGTRTLIIRSTVGGRGREERLFTNFQSATFLPREINFLYQSDDLNGFFFFYRSFKQSKYYVSVDKHRI